MGIFTEEINKLIDQEIEKAVEARIKEFPVHVKIDGVEVDLDSKIMDGGEIVIDISTPFYEGGSL